MVFDGKLATWSADLSALRPVADAVNKIIDRVNTIDPGAGAPGTLATSLSGAGSILAQVQRHPPGSFPVKITTSLGNGNYGARRFAGTIQYASGSASVPGNLSDPGSDNILLVNIAEVNGGAPLAVGTWVLATPVSIATLASGAPAALCVCDGPGGPTIAALASDGGSAGAVGTAASWTYTAKSADGLVTFGTSMALASQRDTWVKQAAKVGIVTPASATIGGASPSTQGWVLIWCDEFTSSSSTC